MFWKMAVRDLLIVSLVIALWSQLGHLSAGAGMRSDLIGVVLGLALGACFYLAHEWGHLLAGLACRSSVRPPQRLSSGYLFSFDSRGNSRRQFLIMSLGGFVVTGMAVWIVYALLPDEQLASRVARGAVLFLASLAVLVEFPLVIWALVRPTLPPVETFATHRREQAAL